MIKFVAPPPPPPSTPPTRPPAHPPTRPPAHPPPPAAPSGTSNPALADTPPSSQKPFPPQFNSPAPGGIEDIFKSLRRLTDKGAENEVINLNRMYLMSCMAAPACFPSVAQEEITQADWEDCRGHAGLDEFRGILPRWNRTRTGLASGCFRPTERATEIPKPIAGQKTCTSAAHSQQVALEECLLDCSLLPDGSFETITAITHSWVSGLIFTVQQTAVGVLEPTVLVHEASGCAYLIVLSLGRCVYGWPLRVQNAEKMLLVMTHPIQALVPIVLTSAHLGPAIPIQAIAFAIVSFHIPMSRTY
jgi:hypothetical protein